MVAELIQYAGNDLLINEVVLGEKELFLLAMQWRMSWLLRGPVLFYGVDGSAGHQDADCIEQIARADRLFQTSGKALAVVVGIALKTIKWHQEDQLQIGKNPVSLSIRPSDRPVVSASVRSIKAK